MKTKQKTTFTSICVNSCRAVRAQFRRIKNGIRSEFTNRFGVDERLLRLALSEAEAEAWATGYPHLVFPGLADEKAQALLNWDRKQKAILHAQPAFAFAE